MNLLHILQPSTCGHCLLITCGARSLRRRKACAAQKLRCVAQAKRPRLTAASPALWQRSKEQLRRELGMGAWGIANGEMVEK